MSSTAVRILTGARKRVAHRWIQHKAYDDMGGVCAGHAIDLEYDVLYQQGEAEEADRAVACNALQEVAVRHHGFYPSIPDWNDADGRSKSAVLLMFDKAIAMLVEEETPKVTLVYPTLTTATAGYLPYDPDKFLVTPTPVYEAVVKDLVIPPMPEPEPEKSFVKKMADLIGV